MGGQVLGGGVIVLVAVLLWLVYLLPSWHSRHQFNAAERNAVRLNQALRVLAETSETPEEVRLELNARTALAQQRLAKRAKADLEQAELERSRAEAEIARAELEKARAERAAAHAQPAARRARARRRTRLVVTTVGIAALGLIGWGVWSVVTTGSQLALWTGGGVAVLCGALLHRMSRVAVRSEARAASAPEAVRHAPSLPASDLLDDRTWTPRTLPQPLASASGSQAAAALDTADAQRALREAAREEALRSRAERLSPPPPDIAAARAVRDNTALTGQSGDAEIEEHVRQLLARRAAG
ncbi:MAG: large exoprotein [Microbacterium sp.]|uniref:large exoprotein n=1 Tax=Microbacterium sp. TaxID=51671 RepID=UPI0039E437F0